MFVKCFFLFLFALCAFLLSSIKVSTFKELASEICIIFPGEREETYYVPAITIKETYKESGVAESVHGQAAGKLWCHYNYLKGVKKLEGSLFSLQENPEQITALTHGKSSKT